MKQVEPNKWLSLVITHPDTIYGPKKTTEEESETIANNKMTTSSFTEEDSSLFKKILVQFHDYFCMFHGSVTQLYEAKSS